MYDNKRIKAVSASYRGNDNCVTPDKEFYLICLIYIVFVISELLSYLFLTEWFCVSFWKEAGFGGPGKDTVLLDFIGIIH